MTKLKTMKLKLSAAILVAVLVGVAGLVGGVKAFSSYNSPKVVVEGDFIEAQAVQADVSSPVLGSVASPDIQSLWLAVNGDTEYHIVAPLTNLNPFGSTADSIAVVDTVRMDVTAAPTTSASNMFFNCGASADGKDLPDVDLLDINTISATATGTYANNLTAALGGSADGGTVAKIALTPTNPYFVCFVSSTAGVTTNSNSTWAGKVTVVIKKTR
jgi:hypothetical protein